MATKREIRTYAQINDCSIDEARQHFINEAKKRNGVPDHADDFAKKRFKSHDWIARKSVIDNDGTWVQTRSYDHTGDTVLSWFNMGINKGVNAKGMKNPIAEFIKDNQQQHCDDRLLYNKETGRTTEDTPALRLLGDISSAYSHYQMICVLRARGAIPADMMNDQDEQTFGGIFSDYVADRCREVFSNTREVLLEYMMVATGDEERPYAFGCRTAELRDKDGVLITDLLCPQSREGETLH